MRFLVDQQLPPALARFLTGRGHVAEPVRDVGLAAAWDARVWAYALEREAILITKDEDVSDRNPLDVPAPVVVWVRLGNTRRSALLAWFDARFPEIVALLEAGEQLIEIR